MGSGPRSATKLIANGMAPMNAVTLSSQKGAFYYVMFANIKVIY